MHQPDGTVTGSRVYTAFGGTAGTAGFMPHTIGFQSDYADRDTELTWMGARWYNPTTATFTARDTVLGELSTPVSTNRYTYAHANPLGMIDPDGRSPCATRSCPDGFAITGGNADTSNGTGPVAIHLPESGSGGIGIQYEGGPTAEQQALVALRVHAHRQSNQTGQSGSVYVTDYFTSGLTVGQACATGHVPSTKWPHGAPGAGGFYNAMCGAGGLDALIADLDQPLLPRHESLSPSEMFWSPLGALDWRDLAADLTTGNNVEDLSPLIGEAALEAGIDARLLYAVMQNESHGRQLVPGFGFTEDWGKYAVDLAGDGYGIEFFEQRNVTLGIGQMNQATFQDVQRNHPDLGGSWFSLPHDHTLAIRSTAHHLADIQTTEVNTRLSRPDQIIETLVRYNGGVDALNAWRARDPFDRSLQYVVDGLAEFGVARDVMCGSFAC